MRNTRVSLVAAALAATGVFIGGTAAVGGVFTGERTVASAGASAGDSAPASEPKHDDAPQPVASIPKDDPPTGMVYTGLRAAPKGDRCVGALATADGHCTHGPDEPPKGVDISKDTPPAVKADLPAADLGKPSPAEPSSQGPSADTAPALDAQAGRSAAAAVPSGTPSSTAVPNTAVAAPAGQAVVCDGDGTTGNRVQVVYAHVPGRDRYAQYVASFRKWAADADAIYFASAQETGGVRHIRFVTAADCTPTVLNVELSDSAMSEFSATNSALATKGFNRLDRKYMIFADTNIYCGIGTFNGDERPGQNNQSNFGPSYGRTDSGCWNGSTAAHELGHNLGAVNNSAPNTSRGAHCTDEWDVMCYSDTPYYPKMRIVCPEQGHDLRLDCNHDDYYNTSPRPGSYLATHWNVANNQFLMTGNGTKPDPTPTPSPTPTSNPSPGPTGSTGPSTGPDVTVGQLAPDSAVASWQSVNSAAWYQVFLNGKHLGWVKQNSTRLYNLRPDTDYTVAVAVRDTSGRDSKPGRTVSFHTPKAGGTTTAPATAYTLTNGATGLAAAVWGGKTADGTVLVGSQATGYADQRWYFDDAGSGYVRIKSAVSGKCLQLGGTPVVGQWVAQQPCDGKASQQWRLASSDAGVSVTARDSALVLGVGGQQYYGARLLELQDPAGAGYHSWTLQKTS
ncbi:MULTISPECIES: RICIN domain-containing protein [unclassified Kitasatospora]|uniref:RICIN domain-containing protein n=1 Tax=unclassified Kitasatospora TaxID=2633591 RepID=UPI001F406D97|nr:MULTISPECIES: RICIN domain-containing protein [unclassified Kitasatospora]